MEDAIKTAGSQKFQSMQKIQPISATEKPYITKKKGMAISRPFLTLVKNSSNAIISPILGLKSKYNNNNTSNADLTHLQVVHIA